MKNLYIVGAGGFGRELFAWIEQHPDCGRLWKVAGFIDDNPDALNTFDYPVGIKGSIQDHQPSQENCYICAIGTPAIKKLVCESLEARGADFISFIHPSVIIGANLKLGRGIVLCPRVTLTSDVSIGNFALINCHSSVGHDVQVGDWVTVSGHCDLTGNCRIGEAAFLATGVRIIPNSKIGASAFVGAGSVVIKSVAAKAKVFGNPAKVFG